MGAETKIEWCDKTFNPWRGCTKVSAGCANCYAETFSGRNPKVLGVWGPNGTRVVAAESQWREPLKWNKEAELAAELFRAAGGDASEPGSVQYKGRTLVYAGRPRVFCASLADVFEDWRGDMLLSNGNVAGREIAGGGMMKLTMQDVRARLFDLIDATPNLDWLLLTKRPENILNMMPGAGWVDDTHRAIPVRANVWFGTSAENQEAADARIPHLLKVPAAVRFLSCEPLLGPVDIRRWLALGHCPTCRSDCFVGPPGGPGCGGCADSNARRALNWVIVGGESGPGARPMQLEWARSLVQQCKAANVACFVKQLGARPLTQLGVNDGHPAHWPVADPKGSDPDEWPEDLRVRQFPEVKAVTA